MKLDTILGLPLFLSELSVIIGLGLLVAFGEGDVKMVVGVFAIAAFRLLPALRTLLTGWTQIQNAAYSLNTIEEGLAGPAEAVSTYSEEIPFEKEITVRRLAYTYPDSGPVLDNFNCRIRKGEHVGFRGASGAGKSTLLRGLCGVYAPDGGKVLIDGRDITGVKGKELADVRAGIGMIFQNFSLFQQRTVLRNVTFPLELNHTPKAKREERARYLLDLVGLADLADRYPSQLSGGQQQRVAIARALANNPSIMLCDEATSALDSTTTAQILDLLRRINRELNVTLVVITHSLSVARNICDRVAMIDGGRIVEMGDTEALFADPHSDILKTLIADAKVTNHRHTHETADGAKNGAADDSAQKEVK